MAETIDVDFVDDVVFMFSAVSADGLLLEIGLAVDIIIETFRSYGLEVNLKPGKSEVVMQLF